MAVSSGETSLTLVSGFGTVDLHKGEASIIRNRLSRNK